MISAKKKKRLAVKRLNDNTVTVYSVSQHASTTRDGRVFSLENSVGEFRISNREESFKNTIALIDVKVFELKKGRPTIAAPKNKTNRSARARYCEGGLSNACISDSFFIPSQSF